MRRQYGAFNTALQSLYEDTDTLTLAADGRPAFDDKVFEEAADMVYHEGGFNLSQMADPKVRKVVDETLNAISTGIETALPHSVPETLRYALENNAFIFSGLKTFHALREVGLSMVKEDGSIKPFNEFKDDVRKINATYNTNYLYAEYKHALGASQMAAKWNDLQKDGDRYLLQYRTAGDDKVRADHALLDGTTLPASDPFWDKYYPPNGWGCRCTAVQVRRGKYPESDPALAMTRGDNATEAAKQQIFRFNAGKKLELFPPKHPYYKAPQEAKKAATGYVPQTFEAKTIAEAEQQFSSKLGVQCCFKGIKKKDIGQVEEIFKCIDEHFQKFPELRKVLKFVGSIAGRAQLLTDAYVKEWEARNGMTAPDYIVAQLQKRAKSTCACTGCYAYSSRGLTQYGLNGLAFNNAMAGEKAVRCLTNDVKQKWHPINCGTIKAVFDHEVGHKLDELLALYTDRDFLTIFNEAKAQGVAYIKDNLSQYAYNPKNGKTTYGNYTAEKEFIAEAWSEYLNNEPPRPIAAAVGMLIMKKYKAMKKNQSKSSST
ncbi:MAG: minor capsid protein [Prevotella sp.]|nr:minor capsid protein [Prevotella sp.]